MAAPILSRRGITILIAVIGVALIVERVVASAGGDGDTVVAVASPARAGAARSAVRPPVAAETLLRLDRLASERAAPADDEAIGKLFEPQSWQPPQPKPVLVQAVPVRPVPPPFPYAYMGGMSDGSVRTAFFTRGERVLPVHPGDTIDAVFHVDELNDVQMILTYLPLHETVTVVLGVGP
jgi:hypothetical protein